MGLLAGPGLLFVPPDRFRNMPRPHSSETVGERVTSAVLPASEQHIVMTLYCFGGVLEIGNSVHGPPTCETQKQCSTRGRKKSLDSQPIARRCNTQTQTPVVGSCVREVSTVEAAFQLSERSSPPMLPLISQSIRYANRFLTLGLECQLCLET